MREGTDFGGQRGSSPYANAAAASARADADRELVRKVRRERVHGQFQSMKVGSVFWSKGIERDFMCLLEVDPIVASYVRKGDKIQYRVGGEDREHTPTFTVHRVDGAVAVIDVVEKVESRPEAAILFDLYAQKSISYRLMTWDQVRTQPRFDAVRYILRYKAVEVSEELRIAIMLVLSRKPVITLRELEQAAWGEERGRRFVLSLAARGMIHVDTSRPIGDDTIVSLARGASR